MNKYLEALARLFKAVAKNPLAFCRVLNIAPAICDSYKFAKRYNDAVPGASSSNGNSSNPLWEYFQNHQKGNGIWKWAHYFDIYHRHFQRFVGKKVNVLEIGVYSGGSLEMWRSYFGDGCHVHGVDIEESCKSYENDYVSIHIGDQADRAFWQRFRSSVSEGIDILIDDGGHTPEQQRVTLEEMLPNLNPGGIFLCEDIHGRANQFSAYAAGLVNELNHYNFISAEPLIKSSVVPLQSSIYSIHFYPYVCVIEKRETPVNILTAPRHGDCWQPNPNITVENV